MWINLWKTPKCGQKEAKMTKNEAKSAIIRIVIGAVTIVAGIFLSLVSDWFLILSLLGLFLLYVSTMTLIVIKNDPDYPPDRK
jgi:fatty acid desaturase